MSWQERLAEVVGAGRVTTDPDIIASYSRDQAATAESGRADALVRARSIEDVVATMRFASDQNISVVTRAAGTGLSGGANALDGGIILSVLALNEIIDLDARLARVQAGVLNGDLARAVKGHGLFYAPDPASRDISTIGGNIATNAGGACCLKYGVTGDHVLSLKVVMANGDRIETGCNAVKNVAGLDLTSLLVGSEGTLGIIVEACVALRPLPPPASTLVAFFDTMQDAGAAIAKMEIGVSPSLIEIMDRSTVTAVENLTHMELDTSAAAMVLVQCDSRDASGDIERCESYCLAHKARDVYCTGDADEARMLLAARSAALPALEKLGNVLLDDVSVPKPRLGDMLSRCQDAAAKYDLTIGCFGHAGDGNLHPTIVFDAQNAESVRAARGAFDDIVKAAVELGGSITGEHGVGTLKRDYLESMVGTRERGLMLGIKQVFDPQNILNPGRGY